MNNNIPNFATDNTAALVQNQLAVAKSQKAEKEREMETEPIRMVGQEMIESGAKGIAGYLTKKTKLKSFGALGANVAKHGVAAGVARTAAAAGHEALATGGKAAQAQLTKALEKHTAALQQAASGFQTKVKSKVKDLGSSLESRVANLSDQAQAEAQKRGKQAAALGNKVVSEGKDAVAKGVGQAQAAVSDVGNKVQAVAGDAQAAASDVGNKVQAVAGDAQAAAAAAVPKAGGIAASQAAAASASQKVIDAKLAAEQQRTTNLAAAAPEGGDPRLAAEQQRVPNAFNSKTVTAEPVQSQRFGGLNDQLRKTSAGTQNDALNSMLSDLQSKSESEATTSFGAPVKQGLNDLNMLPKTEQLGKLPSSAAAAKALQNGGATNISRAAAKAAPLKAAAGETPSLVKAASGGASGSGGSVGSTFGKKKGGVASQAKAFSVEPNRVSEGSSRTPLQKSSTPVLDEITNARKASGDPRFAASSTIQDTGQSAPGSAPREPDLLPGIGGLADNESEEPGLLPGKGGLANKPPLSAADKLNKDIATAQSANDAVSQVSDIASTAQSAPGTAPTAATEPPPASTPAGQIPTTDPTPPAESSGGGGGGGGEDPMDDMLEEGGDEEGAEEAEGAAGGIESDLTKATAASTVADESPIGDMITGALGIASLVGGLFSGHSGDTASPPSMGSMAQSYQAGATNNA